MNQSFGGELYLMLLKNLVGLYQSDYHLDCLLYRNMTNQSDSELLQKHWTNLEN
jgi:hypothetical protein